MWIKRDDYSGLVKENAALASQVKGQLDQIQRMEREVEYWREKFESALNRSDRLVDLVTQQTGNCPVSDLGVAEVENHTKQYKKMLEEVAKTNQEMFSEEIPSEGDGVQIEDDLAASLVGAFN